MTDLLIAVIILGLANGAIVQIVTFSSLFEPVRNIGLRWKHPAREYYTRWIQCALCFGLWSAAALAGVTVWRADHDLGTLDALLVWGALLFAVHTVGLITGYSYRVLLGLTYKLE